MGWPFHRRASSSRAGECKAARALTFSALSCCPPGRAALPNRKLLDLDKLIFTVAADGSVHGHAQPVLVLRAQRLAVHRHGPGAARPVLLYNIVLVRLYWGVLPRDTLPAIGLAAAGLLLLALCLPLWTERAVPALLDWLLLADQPSPLSPPPPPPSARPPLSAAPQQRSKRR